MNRRGFLKSILSAGGAPYVVPKPPPRARAPFEDPLPEYEIEVPIVDGMVHIRAAFDRFVAKRGRAGSAVLRFPAGEYHLPPRGWSSDPKWGLYLANLGTDGHDGGKESCIAILGAKDGKTVIKGDLQSASFLNLTSSCIGTWRVGDFDLFDIPGVAFGFGTGGYNAFVHRMVMQNIRARYCSGYFIMAGYEEDAKNPINDELWMRNVDFQWGGGSHTVYIDQRDYTYAENCTFRGGKNHAFKCEALWTDIYGMEVSNVDPVMRDAHRIGMGVSAVFPNGFTFYGANSPMSLLGLGGGYARKVKLLKVWPQSQAADGGGYGAARQARWSLYRTFPRLVDNPNADYWIAARAAGIDNPDNPYLRPHRWLYEDCDFEFQRKPGSSASFAAIGNQGTHPCGYDGFQQYGYYPIRPAQPDLWFERSRDFAFNCRFTGDWNVHFRALLPFSQKGMDAFPEDTERAKRDQHLIYSKPAKRSAWAEERYRYTGTP